MVAIKDMAIPSCCGECDFCTDNWECILLNKRANNIVGYHAKLSDCPLVEIEEHKVGKLERIEKIVDAWNNDASHSFSDMCKINGILKE